MSNFFQSPAIQQVPNPEPPGYSLIRQMMLQRLMQQFTNPYGMSPGGQANFQGFNQGSKPFDPYGGGSSGPSSGGYNYLSNAGMPGMGGGMPGMGGSQGSAPPGQGQAPGGMSSGQIPALLQALMATQSAGRMQGAMPQPPMGQATAQPFAGAAPSQGRTTMPSPQQTSNYDGNVVGYGGNIYGAPQSHGALPHLLGLLRMAHTQPRGMPNPGMGPRPVPGGMGGIMPTAMPTHGMAMPIPTRRGR